MDQVKSVGVIGAGSFGLALANLIAANADVIIFSRRQDAISKINQQLELNGISL
ncbi:MAG: NAD(P)-binding domain-containing protein, partial [Bacteroidota bacterium]